MLTLMRARNSTSSRIFSGTVRPVGAFSTSFHGLQHVSRDSCVTSILAMRRPSSYVSARIRKDKKHSLCAFVDYEDTESATKARAAAQGSLLKQRSLNIFFSKNPEPPPSGGGGGNSNSSKRPRPNEPNSDEFHGSQRKPRMIPPPQSLNDPPHQVGLLMQVRLESLFHCYDGRRLHGLCFRLAPPAQARPPSPGSSRSEL